MLTNSESVGEEPSGEDDDDEVGDIEGELINPDLIGASQALHAGDLDKYAAIVSGHQIVEMEHLMT